MKFQESVLDNGLRVASAEMPQIASVSLGIWVGVGGRFESKRMSGVSHFIEHLLFKGTRNRTAQEISQAIEGLGGYFNAFTQEESTCYYARIASDKVWGVFDVLSDMYLRPLFAKDDIDKERNVIIEEIMMYRDRPHNHVEDMLGSLLWKGHPLGRPLIGPPSNITRMTRAEILDFKTTKYVPSNTVVTFAGNITHAECVKRVKKAMGRLPRRRSPACQKVNGKTGLVAADVQTRPIEQSHLAMGVRVFGRQDRRRYALKLLSVILGENMSSRLFQVVREKHGLAYSVHSSVQLFQDTGAFVVQAGLDREKTIKALSLIVRELDRVRNKKVGGAELQRAKDYVMGQMRLSLESTTSQMMWVGENMMNREKFTQPETLIKKLEAVTSEQIQDVAHAVFKKNRLSTAIIVPADRDRHLDAIQKERSKL